MGLFTDVYRYANFKTRERREVLLTAALSFCLESVSSFRMLLLGRACRTAGVSLPPGRAPSTVHVAHQASLRRFEEDNPSRVQFDRPDILIHYPSGTFACAIECKLRDEVSNYQATRYATQLLATAEGARCLLIGISADHQARPEGLDEVGWASLPWTEVDDLAREAAESMDGRKSHIPRYLLEELRKLLMSEGLVFRGLQTEQLGENAGHALRAYSAWYDLVKIARRALREYVTPKSMGRATLRRTFTGFGFDAIGKNWDLRKVHRTKVYIWIGAYPHDDGGEYPTDWYAGAALYFSRHPQRSQLLEDRSIMRTVGHLCTRNSFELNSDGFIIHGDTIPATTLFRGCKTPAAQQERAIEHWTKQVRTFCDSDVVTSLLDYHG